MAATEVVVMAEKLMKLTLTLCQWASISRELRWKYMALCGKESLVVLIIEEAIAAYSVLDDDALVGIELDDGQADLLKQTVKEMLGNLGVFANDIGLNEYYKLP